LREPPIAALATLRAAALTAAVESGANTHARTPAFEPKARRLVADKASGGDAPFALSCERSVGSPRRFAVEENFNMTDARAKSEVLDALTAQAIALGLSVEAGDDGALSGATTVIHAKWLLGGRSATYRMSCRLDEADHAVRFREIVSEKSWGLPPPTLTMTQTTVAGWARSGVRRDLSLGGGGSIDYEQAREALKRTTEDAGWRFEFEGGRAP
jgi:hypothetical protein